MSMQFVGAADRINRILFQGGVKLKASFASRRAGMVMPIRGISHFSDPPRGCLGVAVAQACPFCNLPGHGRRGTQQKVVFSSKFFEIGVAETHFFH